jgi:hypothetical protein
MTRNGRGSGNSFALKPRKTSERDLSATASGHPSFQGADCLGTRSGGMDEGLADQWLHGAIRWRSETDKQGLEPITPISLAARTELERYLQLNPRAGAIPLFPSGEIRTRLSLG